MRQLITVCNNSEIDTDCTRVEQATVDEYGKSGSDETPFTQSVRELASEVNGLMKLLASRV